MTKSIGIFAALLIFLIGAFLQPQAAMAVKLPLQPDGEPGFATYMQAKTFAESVFLFSIDYDIYADPDGGYVVIYELIAGVEIVDIKKSVEQFRSVNDSKLIIDLITTPFSMSDLYVNRTYDATLNLIPAKTYSVVPDEESLIPATVQFDYMRDGFGNSPEDYEFKTLIPFNFQTDSFGTINAPSAIHHSQIGDWRARIIIDEDEVLEDAKWGKRANNTSPWANYEVVIDPLNPPSDPSSFKVVAETGMLDGGYGDKNPSGFICNGLDFWVYDTRSGNRPVTVDVIVDGSYMYTAYQTKVWPHIKSLMINWSDPAWRISPDTNSLVGHQSPWPASLMDGNLHTIELIANSADGTKSVNIANVPWYDGASPAPTVFQMQCAPQTNVIDLAVRMPTVGTQAVNTAFTISNVVASNFGDVDATNVEVVLYFDKDANGFTNNANGDFKLTKNVAAMPAVGDVTSLTYANIIHTDPGTWAVRASIDPQVLVEPTTQNTRANNNTGWLQYEVVGAAPDSAPTCTLSASDDSIFGGDSINLLWNTNNAVNAATISDGTTVYNVNANDTNPVLALNPASNVTYTMTVTDSGGASNTCSETIGVAPPPTLDLDITVNTTNTFVAPDDINLKPADAVKITWAATNVTNCTTNFGPSGKSGTYNINPLALMPGDTVEYKVTCPYGADPVRYISKAIEVSIPGIELTLTSDPEFIRQGESSTVTYTINLSEALTIGSATMYDLSCSLRGAASVPVFSSLASQSGSAPTMALENSTITELSCVEPVTGYEERLEDLIEVVPEYQEI